MELGIIFMSYPTWIKAHIKTRWSNKQLTQLFRDGFKWCNKCGYMIKTDERGCRICGRQFRASVKTSKNKWKYAERRSDPQIILLKKRD